MNIRYKPVLLVLLSFALLCMPSRSYSDGIYVTKDLKHVFGPHITMNLSKQQTQDVEQKRTVELSDDQLMLLREIYDKIPKKLPVLSSRWDSCTCDLGVYAIWCRPGEIDIPHSSIQAQKELDEYIESNPAENAKADNDSDAGDSQHVGESIILDSKADMFIAGRLVTEREVYRVIDKLSTKQVKASRVYRSLFLDLPPPIDNIVDQRIEELVDRLEQYSKKKGVEFWALGLSYERSNKKAK
jgi:hypothetical protein